MKNKATTVGRSSKSARITDAKNRKSKTLAASQRRPTLTISQKALPPIVIFLVLGMGLLLFLPINSSERRTQKVDFVAKHIESAELEIGEVAVEQEGVMGEKVTNYSVRTNLFNLLFGLDGQREKVSAKITREPVQKILSIGTKKYQYMLCSDGTSRYYTDKQFQKPNVGFTSKSEDYCAKNNQGTKLRLADSLSQGQQQPPRPLPSVNCTTTDLPYTTVYCDVSYLNKGDTRVIEGYNGWIFDCHDGSKPIRVEPMNKIVSVGTYVPQEPTTTGSPSQNPGASSQAASICKRDYDNALAQLRMYNATGSSSMQQIQSFYQQCMRRAGY